VKFRNDKLIDEFAMHLNSPASKLHALGEKIDEMRLVKKMLRVVLKQYWQITLSIETILDLNTLSLEGLVDRLRVAEDRAMRKRK
jgi:hypothetical protein